MSKEENIKEVERAAKTVQITGRVSQAVKDEFEQLREAGGYDTFSLFMEALLERYNNPLKINKDNVAKIDDLQTQISKLNEELKKKSEELEEMDRIRGEFKEHNDSLLAKYKDIQEKWMAQNKRIDELEGIDRKMDGHILVPVDALDMCCLQYLADRENKRRKREDITLAVFFQYAVREMLIKGNKFSIDSVPDSKIAQFKAEIAHGQ